MKFKCGLTDAEIQAAHEAARLELKRLREWHRVFAWRPVRIARGDCRWLEWVERRYDAEYCWFYASDTIPRIRKSNPEYRAIEAPR